MLGWQGFRFYDDTFEVKVVRASAEAYFSTLFIKSYNSDLQHGWLSSVAKTESYNETFHDSEKVKTFKDILNSNPKIGKHFNRKATTENEIEEATFGEEEAEKDTVEVEWQLVWAKHDGYTVYVWLFQIP